jgi:hypothetical protein
LDLEEVVLAVVLILIKVVVIPLIVEVSNVIILAFSAAFGVTLDIVVANMNAIIPFG